MNLSTSSTEEHRQVAAEDDLSLILRMACKDSNREDAEIALATFFERHHVLVKAFAVKNNFRSLGFDPDDFVIRTFHKAYDRIETFDSPVGLMGEKLEKKVRCWLFEIAKNEFLMELRKLSNHSEETTDEELTPPAITADISEHEEPILKGKSAAVRTFLAGLPEGDCQLLETSMKFYDFKAKKAVIPEEILQGLANALGTTPEGIKQRRKRLLQKLKAHLEKV